MSLWFRQRGGCAEEKSDAAERIGINSEEKFRKIHSTTARTACALIPPRFAEDGRAEATRLRSLRELRRGEKVAPKRVGG